MSDKPRNKIYVSMSTGHCWKNRGAVGMSGWVLSTLPRVCPRCWGRGDRRQQGCFGSRYVGPCLTCDGKGRVSEDLHRIITEGGSTIWNPERTAVE